MTISATNVRFEDDTMWVDLSDGRTLGVPLAWFPRLLRASPAERKQPEITRVGLHWEGLDEASVGWAKQSVPTFAAFGRDAVGTAPTRLCPPYEPLQPVPFGEAVDQPFSMLPCAPRTLSPIW